MLVLIYFWIIEMKQTKKNPKGLNYARSVLHILLF